MQIKEKAKHGEGHMPLTNVDNSTSPNGTEFCRPMPVIYGENFFPRVRTPCGHGAQVIVEGREIQSDGGEKDKDNPTTNQTSQTTANHSPQAESPPSCSLSSVLR